MATSQAKSALRQLRREQGLCIHCGAEAIPDQTRCEGCRDKDNANRKRYALRDEQRGICKNTGCSNRVTGTHRYCDSCNTRSSTNSHRRWQARTTEGLCGRCGKQPQEDGKTRCRACHALMCRANRELAARRIAVGKCSSCGLYVLEPGYTHCCYCIDKRCAWHAQLKLEVLAAYGGPRCVGCSETEVALLQMDHINGGGHKHAQAIGGRGKMYKWLKDNGFPPGFRVLCANCNIRAYRKLPFPNDLKE